jgi:Methylase involved in ubiquinone/menaquinone biosynthesis
MSNSRTDVCPVERAGGLDNFIRRWLQNPKKLLRPYIMEGAEVLDMGCGPGFFSIEIAKLLNNSGNVIAADLQEGMLDKVRQKIQGTALEHMITLHQCQERSIGLTVKVDFILAFYMVHEVPDRQKLLEEMTHLLKPGGKILIVEPKFHVSKESFKSLLDETEKIGLKVIANPKITFSRAVLLTA